MAKPKNTDSHSNKDSEKSGVTPQKSQNSEVTSQHVGAGDAMSSVKKNGASR